MRRCASCAALGAVRVAACPTSSGRLASCAVLVVIRVAAGPVCSRRFASCAVIVAISCRTASMIACCRFCWMRSRSQSKRSFARAAKRQTNARDTHALQRCVPSCVLNRFSCQAENSACGLRSAQQLHFHWCRSFAAHCRQHRLSTFLAFHAATPKSASGFAIPHLAHGFFISHVKHTR